MKQYAFFVENRRALRHHIRTLQTRRTVSSASSGKMMVLGMVTVLSIVKRLLSVYDTDALKRVLLHLIAHHHVLGYTLTGGIWICISLPWDACGGNTHLSLALTTSHCGCQIFPLPSCSAYFNSHISVENPQSLGISICRPCTAAETRLRRETRKTRSPRAQV